MGDWCEIKLGDLFDVKAGGDLQENFFSLSQSETTPYPIYSNSLNNNGLYGFTSNPRYPVNCVTITGRGELGHAEYRETPFDAIVRLLVLIPKVEVNCKYITYYINHQVKFAIESTGVPQLPAPRIKKLKINIPKIVTEQTAIASILSKVDEAIEATQNSIKAAEKLKKALMQNLLTGKLKPDGTWRTEDEYYMDEKFGKVPVGWHIIKGNRITEKITKGQSPKWQGFEYQSNGILFITSENVQNGYIDLKEPKYLPIEFHHKIKNSQLQKGDVLINIVGASIGRCSIFNLEVEYANTNQAVCVFRPNQENDSKFLSCYLQDGATQRRLLGTQVETARANLSLGDFRKFRFIIPFDKKEQTDIANKISKVNNISVNKQTKIQTLQRLKKSLMQNLLTGKIRVDITKINELLKKQENE